jgi:putative transposase
MPRANRYMLPGCLYHLTHRCHDRGFLLRFARDRDEYRRRLRRRLAGSRCAVLDYAITSNHVHLLLRGQDPGAVSTLMQRVQGEFALHYNTRKERKGAFWDGRFGCTMVQGESHFWNCMRYVDLNMVRAGVVDHPSDWRWCGYQELTGRRTRFRILDIREVLAAGGIGSVETLQARYGETIEAALRRGRLAREPMWTESIAVGSRAFVESVAARTAGRCRLTIVAGEGEQEPWQLR